MKKADFIQKLSEKINQTQKDTNIIVDEFVELVVQTLKSGDEVVLPDMGKWVVKNKPARTARNPITGETVKVPAKIVPQFKASKRLKDAIVA